MYWHSSDSEIDASAVIDIHISLLFRLKATKMLFQIGSNLYISNIIPCKYLLQQSWNNVVMFAIKYTYVTQVISYQIYVHSEEELLSLVALPILWAENQFQTDVHILEHESLAIKM